ncbi:protein FAR1-RELATED SEQUENCE 9-like [Rosa chinensis]|uniref:protein FAR1-RELATED SEQUENCE 9-like n=1 Tax=Rosa chinensis TaxID=74649 RepID=UPI000D08ABDB|nr:protein FAR1-RELATED SEQUENCE 9-like [Rosa chinensis]
MYPLIFAPLVGVNNHGQTIILACAFLSNETTNSFDWFFKEFLDAMPGDALRMIITDQDPTMVKAISKVLPQTFHRYIWAFLIFIQLVDRLPDQYILKRWMKSRKAETVLDDVGVEITDNRDLLARRSRLCQYAIDVIDKNMGSEEASGLFLDSLKSVPEKYNSMMADGETVKSAIVPVEQKSLSSQHIYNEPTQVRAKGCGKRLKAGKEKGRLKAAKKANGKERIQVTQVQMRKSIPAHELMSLQ